MLELQRKRRPQSPWKYTQKCQKLETGNGVENGVMEVETVVEETGAATLKISPLKMDTGGTSTEIERGKENVDVPPSIPSVDTHKDRERRKNADVSPSILSVNVVATSNKKPKIEPQSAETVLDQSPKKEELVIVPLLSPKKSALSKKISLRVDRENDQANKSLVVKVEVISKAVAPEDKIVALVKTFPEEHMESRRRCSR